MNDNVSEDMVIALAKVWMQRILLVLCLMCGGVGAWAQYTGYLPQPRYLGSLKNSGRKINSISLQGTTTPQQTITCGDNYSYINKMSEHFIIREGETTTATFAWGGSWMHGYVYIDKDQNGTYDNIALGTNGVPTATSELVAYSAYQVSTNNWRKSDGTTTSNNTTLNPPAFTAPTTAGVYYMRYMSDWNCIDPYGSSGDFQESSGVAIDVALWVVKEYTLTIVNARAGTSVSIDGATEALYTESGTVLSTNPSIARSNITATDSRNLPVDVTVSGTNITVTFTEYVLRKIPIASLDEITDMSGYYILTQDCSAPSSSLSSFTGILDGGFHTISGATNALFDNLNGATVKNIILDNVNISGGANVGAIANTATGNARIYNCGVLATTGSSISGSGNVGSIVGTIRNNARVLNCFSYADVSGGTVAGIVGNNNGTTPTTVGVLGGSGSMVFNCMFFGKVTGSSKYPVFGGKTIENVSGINTYNYFLYDGTDYTNVNSAAGVADASLLNRFDMYRGMMNSHRDLCAMYINNTQSIDDNMRHDIALWLYNPAERETVPYLQLEPCVTNTRRTLDRSIPSESDAYKGKQVGTVSCTFIINGRPFTESLPMTDMNTANWDYTWGKIVLPFANEFSGWTMPASGSNAYDNIITGWEITSISGGTTGAWDGSYNMCNPDCTAKDLYSNNNYVWAQGGNYVVPAGVTSITFTAHIVRCVYLADSYVDIAYNGAYTAATNLGSQLVGDTYNGKTVYHTLATAYAQLQNKTNPADQAIVLVGNYHYNQAIAQDGFPAASGTTSYSAKAATIMSIDADNNQVPDYAFPQFHNVGSGRSSVPSLRFDFVCCPGIGISSYTRAGYLADVDILHSKGWFEVTETGMIHMTEFEIRPQNFTVSSPLILNGGIYDQILQSSTDEYNNTGNNNNLSYIRIGGKAYVKQFWPGHKNAKSGMTINGKPINVSGGQIDQCYMTTDIHNKVITGDVNFYCNGGYIKEYLGAYQEQITGNVTTKVDHALIDAFYGGGSDNAYGTTAQIAGNIDNTINNSYVKFYCAGPKFGTMATGKTVTTHATGTTFGEYYGAGYGGTALTRYSSGGESPYYGDSDYTFSRPWSEYTNNRLVYNTSYGTGVGYDFHFNMYAGGNHRGNCNLYVNYATLSLASTQDVSSTLTNCTLEHDFYGGGCQGMVNGTITNMLNNCSVAGSVFGGGYKASATPIDVYPVTQPEYAVFKAAEGLFTEFGTTTPETYSWIQADNDGRVDNAAKTISTTVDMTQMGLVVGAITTTVSGGTVGANVFGGGNESPSDNNATVLIKGNAQVAQDAFGGGNIAPVGGNTDITLGEAGVADNTHVARAIYGGGALANVGGNTTVNLLGGMVRDVYGGGLGRQESGTNGQPGYVAPVEALVTGNTTVTLNGSKVSGSVFGCNNLNGSPRGHALVHVLKTTAKGGDGERYHVAAVYGGGNQAAYRPTSVAEYSEVIVEGCDLSSIEYVYGGGNAAPVPAAKTTIWGSKEIEYVFGGGNGAGAGNPGADVGYYDYTRDNDHSYGAGTAETNVFGGTVHYVFGGSNTLGYIREGVEVTVESQAKDADTEPCDLDVDEVYGAGNEADMTCGYTMNLGCAEDMDVVYAGAKNANISADKVTLNITSGHFGKVFGGNNLGGKLQAALEVNVDETGCHPVKIDNLYLGGNEAAYSVYGYEDALDADGRVVVKTEGTQLFEDPVVNIVSCTSIGRVFGGGLGETAVIVGNPTVNVNMIPGRYADRIDADGDGIADNDANAIGTVGTIFGGGDAAPVIGNTTINIGTEEENKHLAAGDDTKVAAHNNITGDVFGGGLGTTAVVLGNTTVKVQGDTDVEGNVYGGGNAAEVEGTTTVLIGKEC